MVAAAAVCMHERLQHACAVEAEQKIVCSKAACLQPVLAD
jgi:hypothetical protein